MSDNPPAFPCEAQGDRNVPPEHDYIQTGIYSFKFPGMSLRDWFAGQAIEQCIRSAMNDDGSWQPENAAYHAYLIADAMLAERARTNPRFASEESIG